MGFRDLSGTPSAISWFVGGRDFPSLGSLVWIFKHLLVLILSSFLWFLHSQAGSLNLSGSSRVGRIPLVIKTRLLGWPTGLSGV